MAPSFDAFTIAYISPFSTVLSNLYGLTPIRFREFAAFLKYGHISQDDTVSFWPVLRSALEIVIEEESGSVTGKHDSGADAENLLAGVRNGHTVDAVITSLLQVVSGDPDPCPRACLIGEREVQMKGIAGFYAFRAERKGCGVVLPVP